MGKYLGAGNTIQHTPGADVTAGNVIVIEDKVCVAKNNILTGKIGELDTSGEFLFPKDGATAFTKGKKVYYDTGASEATETEGTNKLIGYVTRSALAADTEVACYLANNAIV